MPKVSHKIHKKVVKKNKTQWYKELDTAMSELVRSKGQCEWCGSQSKQLHWAHVITRGNKALRWDIMNSLCLCHVCHRFRWHASPWEAMEWFEGKYPERYEYLMREKNRFVDRVEDDYRVILEAIKNKQFDLLVYH